MKKLKKQRGFTLVEMLIVVAIIAILVAVSIPLFTNSLERAKNATDAANERDAKAAATSLLLEKSYSGNSTTIEEKYYFDATAGVLKAGAAPTSGGYGQCSTHLEGYVTITFNDDRDKFTLGWSKGDKLHGTDTSGAPAQSPVQIP